MEKRFVSLARLFNSMFGAAALAAVLAACASSPAAIDVGSGAALFPGLGAPEDAIPMDTAIRSGTLPSGLRYYIMENRRPKGRAFLRLAVNSGSVLEEENERGLAHFVEHMAFNGTERFPKSDLVNYLRSLGMRFGPEVNAYTSFNETVYGIEVPVEPDGSVPERALAVLDDWSRALRFDAEAVEAERAVMLEEYRTGLGAMDRVRRRILPVLFQGSPYADRLPIGLPEVILNAPAERLAAFYRRWYRSDNMALILVGDFDGAKLEASLGDHFRIGAPSTPLERPVHELPPPVPGSRNVVMALDDELPYGFVQLYFKRPARSEATSLGERRTELAEVLVTGMLSRRFSEAAQLPETAYAGAGAGESRYGRRSRYFVLSAVPEPASSEATLAALLREVESVRRFGFSAAELERAKASILSDLRRSAAEKDRRESSSLLEGPTAYFLRGVPVTSPEWELRAAEALLPTLDAAEIGRTARGIFADDDLTVVLYGPTAEGAFMPGEERILTMVREAAAAKMVPPADEAGPRELLSRLPEAGALVSESIDAETRAVLWRLGNGARVLHLATANRNDEIILHALARGGQSGAVDADAVSAALAAELAEASGLGPHSQTELQRLLAGSQVALRFDVSQYFRTLRGSSNQADLEQLFQLLHLSFAQPRIHAGAATAALDRRRTLLLQRRESPEAVFSDEVGRIVSGGHPRLEPLSVEALSLLSLERAETFLRESLRAGDFLFVFVGNIDPPRLKELSLRYLASLPPSTVQPAWRDLGVRRPGRTEKVVYKGAEEKSLVYLGWFAPAQYSEKADATARVLDAYLDIRLTEEIRERLGGVYSISSSVSLGAVPVGELALSLSFSTSPERTNELAAAVERELDVLAAGSVDPAILAKAVEALRRTHERSLESNSGLASSFAVLSEALDLGPASLYGRPERFAQVRADDVVRTARALRAGGPARVILYPERLRP